MTSFSTVSKGKEINMQTQPHFYYISSICIQRISKWSLSEHVLSCPGRNFALFDS
uniref:Uncharacterized protein n=1 Tax=Anguilla anguilla TaxID=7936 RepID=A0A0E9PXQ9_ANGAN